MSTASDPALISVPEGVPLLLRDLIHERTGLFFETDRLDLMVEKLRDRVALHRCHSYLDYYYLLKYDHQRSDEWLRVMDAFSVQETYFWRESSQLDALVRHVVPAWFAKHNSPLEIWSAACASGEEPYSIVIALREAGLGHLPIRVYASDASEIALTKARSATYRERSFRALPAALKAKYFRAVPEGWQLTPELIGTVHFTRANLVVPAEMSHLARAGVIFCRNVFIYFSPDAIRRTTSVFADHMRPPGCLFVGSSESLLKLTDRFELHEMGDAFVYVRRSDAAHS